MYSKRSSVPVNEMETVFEKNSTDVAMCVLQSCTFTQIRQGVHRCLRHHTEHKCGLRTCKSLLVACKYMPVDCRHTHKAQVACEDVQFDPDCPLGKHGDAGVQDYRCVDNTPVAETFAEYLLATGHKKVEQYRCCEEDLKRLLKRCIPTVINYTEFITSAEFLRCYDSHDHSIGHDDKWRHRLTEHCSRNITSASRDVRSETMNAMTILATLVFYSKDTVRQHIKQLVDCKDDSVFCDKLLILLFFCQDYMKWTYRGKTTDTVIESKLLVYIFFNRKTEVQKTYSTLHKDIKACMKANKTKMRAILKSCLDVESTIHCYFTRFQ